MTGINRCGDCTMCCKLMGVPEIRKPAGTWCQHCNIGKGCKIYDERPENCRIFECGWLQSQSREPREVMPPELRPDRCKVVIAPSTNPNYILAQVDPGSRDAWQRPAIWRVLENAALNGLRVVVGWGMTREKILVSWDSKRKVMTREKILMSEPDENGQQWSLHQ